MSSSLSLSPSDEFRVSIHEPLREDSHQIKVNFLGIPDDVFVNILHFLRASDIRAISLSCKQGRDIARVEAAWETAAVARFPQIRRISGFQDSFPWRSHIRDLAHHGDRLLSPENLYEPSSSTLFDIDMAPQHFVRSGDSIAIGFPHGSIHFLSLQTGVREEAPQYFQGHLDFLEMRGNLCIAAARTVSNEIWVFNLLEKTETILRTGNEIDGITTFPILVNSDRLIAPSEDTRLAVWNLSSGERIRISDPVPGEGRIMLLALGSDDIVTMRPGGFLEAFNKENLEKTTTFQIVDALRVYLLEVLENTVFIINNHRITAYDFRHGTFLYNLENPLERPIGMTLWEDHLVILSEVEGSGYLQAHCWQLHPRRELIAQGRIIWPISGSLPGTLSMQVVADVLCIADQQNARFGRIRLSPKSIKLWRSYSGYIAINPENAEQSSKGHYRRIGGTQHSGPVSTQLLVESFGSKIDVKKRSFCNRHSEKICLLVTVVVCAAILVIVIYR